MGSLDPLVVIFGVVAFALGAIVGSFLNVLVLRYGTGRLWGRQGVRSECASCGNTLAWYELIPIASFIALGGRCLRCKSRVSLQYPLVEAAAALLFLGVFLHVGGAEALASVRGVSELFFYFSVASILLAIGVYDLRHLIIPDGLAALLVALASGRLLLEAFLVGSPFSSVVQNIGTSFLIPLPFAFLWLVSRGRWMGLGDAKLALGLGLLSTLAEGVSILLLSFWIGALVSVFLLGVKKLLGWGDSALSSFLKPLTIKSEIPFAPFLILAALLVFFTGLDPLRMIGAL